MKRAASAVCGDKKRYNAYFAPADRAQKTGITTPQLFEFHVPSGVCPGDLLVKVYETLKKLDVVSEAMSDFMNPYKVNSVRPDGSPQLHIETVDQQRIADIHAQTFAVLLCLWPHVSCDYRRVQAFCEKYDKDRTYTRLLDRLVYDYQVWCKLRFSENLHIADGASKC